MVVETSIGCGHCRACRTGNRHFCAEMTEIGFTPNAGGYAQYVKAPAANLFRIPDNVSYEEAGIVESVVCPAGALMRWGVRFGETVAVYGVGPAGLSLIQMADFHHVTIVPHAFKTNILMAATLQYIAALPNAWLLEFCEQDTILRQTLTNPVFHVEEDGSVRISSRPGIGVELNWDVVERYLVN